MESCVASETPSLPGRSMSTKTASGRREVVAVLRRKRRTWVHTVREEFATYYPVADLLQWLGGDPLSRSAGMPRSICKQSTTSFIYGDRLYRGGAPKSRPRAQGLP